MSNRFTLVFALSLFAAAALPAGIAGTASSASGRDSHPRPQPAARIEILVDGLARPQYAWSGTQYIEALKNRDYEIRITNPYGVRVAVALSVDGLNTIDARHTTAADGRKWVIGPHETITLSGWQVSLSDARRFRFTTEATSYGQFLGKTQNLGIISAVFFRERSPTPQPIIAGSVPAPDSSAAGASSSEARSGAGASADARSRKGAAAPPAAMPQASPAASVAARESDEYAATGIGQRTAHAVQQVYLDLEDTPAASISIRYEFRPQLVRLGILAPERADDDPLARRQRSQGFGSGFCPEPKK